MAFDVTCKMDFNASFCVIFRKENCVDVEIFLACTLRFTVDIDEIFEVAFELEAVPFINARHKQPLNSSDVNGWLF